MNKNRFKKRIIIKRYNIYLFIFFIVFIYSFNIIKNINNNITPKLLEISNDKIEEITIDIINKSFSKEALGSLNINDILLISKNNNNEIVSVDFKLDNAYEKLRNSIEILQNSLNDLEKGNYKYNDDSYETYLDCSNNNGFIFKIPLGFATNKIFLASFGPKIPVRIEFVGSVQGNIYTKITDYGINNSLIEVYIKLILKEKIILPVKSIKKNNKTNVLLASKIIQGKVPTFYNGILENNSNIIDIPIK